MMYHVKLAQSRYTRQARAVFVTVTAVSLSALAVAISLLLNG